MVVVRARGCRIWQHKQHVASASSACKVTVPSVPVVRLRILLFPMFYPTSSYDVV